MDDYLAEFFNKQEDSYVEEFAFLHEYSNHGTQLYCLCEGKEDKICYFPKIKSITKKDIRIYDVGGKDNVINIFNKCQLQQGYDLNRIMFIVDRDFDESLNNELIYELPVYSIENLYAAKEVLKDFIEMTVGVTNSSIIEKVMENYSNREREFSIFLQELNICLYYTKKIFDSLQKENDSTFSRYAHVNLPTIDDDEVKKYINVTLSEVSLSNNFNEIMDRYSFLRVEDIEKMKEDKFSILNSSKNFKGKYQLYFFLSYLKELLKDMNLGKTKASSRILADKNYGCDIELKDNTLFNILSNYVQLPLSFEVYVKRFLSINYEMESVS